MLSAYRFFPRGTIFVAVIDPGVGGPREAILAEAHGCHFIGPDNGLLSYALAGGPPGTGGRKGISGIPSLKPPSTEPPGPRMRAIENPAYRLPDIGFHLPRPGRLRPRRRVLEPGQIPRHLRQAQGNLRGTGLSRALPPARHGHGRNRPRRLLRQRHHQPHPAGPGTRHDARRGRRHGLKGASRNAITLKAKGKSFPLASFYSEAPLGKPLSVAGSSGFLELSINGGNAARKFGLKRGTPSRWRRRIRHPSGEGAPFELTAYPCL